MKIVLKFLALEVLKLAVIVVMVPIVVLFYAVVIPVVKSTFKSR